MAWVRCCGSPVVPLLVSPMVLMVGRGPGRSRAGSGGGSGTGGVGAGGVGAGTARFTTAPPNFNMFNPLNGVPLVRGNITANDGIYINKRTTFTLTFN